jgi:protocatechuate 3,4-dioxygenase beta subunit
MVITNLIPGLYDINAEFLKPGFGIIQGGTALVESRKTMEYKFVINIDENTGIQGYITDKNGGPLASAGVILFKYIKDQGIASCGDAITNENGYYKIVGIKEGIYSLRVEKDDECEFHSIIITKNQILDKNLIIECN